MSYDSISLYSLIKISNCTRNKENLRRKDNEENI